LVACSADRLEADNNIYRFPAFNDMSKENETTTVPARLGSSLGTVMVQNEAVVPQTPRLVTRPLPRPPLPYWERDAQPARGVVEMENLRHQFLVWRAGRSEDPQYFQDNSDLPLAVAGPRQEATTLDWTSVAAVDKSVWGPTPEYNEGDSALEIFSMPYFYKGRPSFANSRLRDREAAFAKREIVTVGDFANAWMDAEVQEELTEDVGINKRAVLTFFKQRRGVEDLLHNEQIVALSHDNEIETVRNQYIRFTSLEDIIRDAMPRKIETDRKNRVTDVVVVLGSSGSGKTFFAVNEAAGYLANKQHESGRHTTLYLHPAVLACFIEADDESKPERLTRWIRGQLESKYGKFGRLNMHVSIVLDEVGMIGYFESEENMNNMLEQFKTLSVSRRLVISGTGLAAANLSTNLFPKCRLKIWNVKNVETMLTRKPFNFMLEEAKLVVYVLRRQGMLASLLTNARTCHFLLCSIADSCVALDLRGDKLNVWLCLLRTTSASLITSVVDKYVKRNGLGDLDSLLRRRVAACVFLAIDEAAPGLDSAQPDFTGLLPKEKTVAMGLIEQNMVSKQPKFATSDRRYITVSSAIVVVLYYLLGARAEIFPGWQNQKHVTTRHAYRMLLLDFMKDFRKKYKACSNNYQRLNVVSTLDAYLANLRIVPLRTKVEAQSGEDNADSFLLPRLGCQGVLMNAERASFADVFIRRVLFQCKHCDNKDSQSKVALSDELEKCGLLKSQTQENLQRIVVLALSLIWDGALDSKTRATRRNRRNNSGVGLFEEEDDDDAFLQSQVVKDQNSDAYPDNLLKFRHAEDTLEYVTVKKGSKGKWFMECNGTQIPVPSALPKVSFVLSTNAEELKLTGVFREPLLVRRQHVHMDGRCLSKEELQGLTVDEWNEQKRGTINEGKLTIECRDRWNSYKAMADEAVTIKFLFT
jgi:hypothetical protein